MDLVHNQVGVRRVGDQPGGGMTINNAISTLQRIAQMNPWSMTVTETEEEMENEGGKSSSQYTQYFNSGHIKVYQ